MRAHLRFDFAFSFRRKCVRLHSPAIAERTNEAPSAQSIGARLRERTNPRRVHRLLNQLALQDLDVVYPRIFEGVLREPVRRNDGVIARGIRAIQQARDAGLPMLFVFHDLENPQQVEWNWQRTLRQHGANSPLTLLADSYLVIALNYRELPAVSSELDVPPFEASSSTLPLFVIADSSGRQLASTTGWSAERLVRMMTAGLVQKATASDSASRRLNTICRRLPRVSHAETDTLTTALLQGVVAGCQANTPDPQNRVPVPLTALRSLLRFAISQQETHSVNVLKMAIERAERQVRLERLERNPRR